MSQKKLGVILAYMSEAVRIITALLYTPIMLRILGKTEYGLYQLVASTVSYLSLLNLGFTGTYTRFYIKAKKESKNAANIVNGMFMKLFLLMSIICIICGGILIFNVEAFFGYKLSQNNFQEAKILIGILIISMALSFPTSVFTCNIDANERFIFEKGITLLQNFFNPFLCLPLLLLGYGNVGIVSASLVLTAAKLFVCAWYAIKKLNMQFNMKEFNSSLFKEMGGFTFFIFLNQIIDQVNWNLDKYLLGRLASLSAVAIYGVGSQLNSLYISCSNAISSVFAPQINNIVINENDDGKLTNIFIKVGRIQYIVVYLILLGFLLLGKPFIMLWAGTEYINAYYVAIALMIPMLIPLIQNIGIEIQRAKNKHQVRSIVYLIMAVLNAGVSIPLIMKFGEIGAALGTTISLFLGNILFMNIYYHIKLNINIISFWKSILNMIPASLICLGIGICISKISLNVNAWIELLIKIIMLIVVYFVTFWFCGFNCEEKRMFVEIKLKTINKMRR